MIKFLVNVIKNLNEYCSAVFKKLKSKEKELIYRILFTLRLKVIKKKVIRITHLHKIIAVTRRNMANVAHMIPATIPALISMNGGRGS